MSSADREISRLLDRNARLNRIITGLDRSLRDEKNKLTELSSYMNGKMYWDRVRVLKNTIEENGREIESLTSRLSDALREANMFAKIVYDATHLVESGLRQIKEVQK